MKLTCMTFVERFLTYHLLMGTGSYVFPVRIPKAKTISNSIACIEELKTV